jgi:serine phosphatase RsbU (regulator of sigma subunit)
MAKKIRDEHRHVKDMSIAVKLALIMATLVAVFMAAFGLFLGAFIRGAVMRQVMSAAYEAAYVAAHADVAAWGEYFDTPFQGLSHAELTELVKTMSSEEYEAQLKSPEVMELRTWNRGRLKRMIDADLRILAVEVLDVSNGPKLLAQSYSGDLVFAPVKGDPPVSFSRGGVAEGFLTVQGIQRHVIRGVHPIISRDEDQQAEIAVYIAAQALADATRELYTKVTLSAMVFIFVGCAVAWQVGRRMMRPIQQLQEDMRIVADGDLEHRTQVHVRDEIGELARTFDRMTESLAEAQQIERDTAASRHQMGVAGEVATSLFPQKLPAVPGYDLAGHHEASGQLGGEYYDAVAMPGGRLGLLIGSASGTGVPAAMVMAMARSFLTVLSRNGADPGQLLREANALLSVDLRRGMYVTVLMAVLDPKAATLTIANAGHPPLLVCKAGGKGIAPVHSEGIALGFDKGPVFDRTLKVVRVRLGAGDRVVMYTPGATRVTGADGKPLGERRFLALVKREAGHAAALFTKRVAATIKKFRGETTPSEDVTLLTLGRQASGRSGAA